MIHILELQAASDGVLGCHSIHEDLRCDGETAGINRVGRLMNLDELYGIPHKRRWRQKGSRARPPTVQNYLNRDFEASEPNTKWATDITYGRRAEDWLYLCAVIDLYTRLVVGWSMSAVQNRQFVLQAALVTPWRRQARSPLVLHYDRGCQSTSAEHLRFLQGHNVTCSMSGVSSCADNALVDGFFGILKRERVNRRHYRTRVEARADIFDYIESIYNPWMRSRLEGKQEKEIR